MINRTTKPQHAGLTSNIKEKQKRADCLQRLHGEAIQLLLPEDAVAKQYNCCQIIEMLPAALLSSDPSCSFGRLLSVESTGAAFIP